MIHIYDYISLEKIHDNISTSLFEKYLINHIVAYYFVDVLF